MKFNVEHKRKMAKENTHATEDHECLLILVRKLQISVVALKEEGV